MLHFENLHRYFRLGLKLTKNTWCTRIESITIVKKMYRMYFVNSNKLIVGKMKDETGFFAIKECVGLKPKMYSFMVNGSSKYKKV